MRRKAKHKISKKERGTKMKIQDVLKKDFIIFDAAYGSKDDALEAMVTALDKKGKIKNKKQLFGI